MKKINNAPIVFFPAHYKIIADMPDEKLVKIFRGIFEWRLYGSVFECEDMEMRYVFDFLIDAAKNAQSREEKLSEVRRESGIIGNNVKYRKNSQNDSNLAKNDNIYINNKDIELDIKKLFLFVDRVCPVNAEYERFNNYYGKCGWVDGKGVPITDKLACAKNWDVPESKKTLLAYQASAWRKIYDQLAKAPESHLLITDLIKIEIKNATLIITCTSAMCKLLENHINIVKSIVSSDFHCTNLTYKIVNNQ